MMKTESSQGFEIINTPSGPSKTVQDSVVLETSFNKPSFSKQSLTGKQTDRFKKLPNLALAARNSSNGNAMTARETQSDETKVNLLFRLN